MYLRFSYKPRKIVESYSVSGTTVSEAAFQAVDSGSTLADEGVYFHNYIKIIYVCKVKSYKHKKNVFT